MAGALEGKVAAITGASSGIGEATTLALVAEGAKVSLAARREDRIAALAKRVNAGRALAVQTDVTDEDQARAFIQRTKDELGRLDFLINNAGVMLLGPVAGADTEHWRRMIEVNLLGLLYCTHAALPIMGEQGSGHIVNVSSVAGRSANMGSAVYNMTKFGVNGFSEGLRQEVLHAGVRVTIVEPGFVDTELQGHNELPAVTQAIDRMRDQTGKVLDANDIAGAIVNALAQPQHVSINEILIRPTGQQR
jgi:NADP-dependent 3-hydroxy acid dehydrogenase YdfG